MYYPTLTRELKKLILAKFPNSKPVLKDVDTITDDLEMACYILWMLERIQTFESDNVAKRGRWVGYIHSRAETLGIVTNAENRLFTRSDLQFPQ